MAKTNRNTPSPAGEGKLQKEIDTLKKERELLLKASEESIQQANKLNQELATRNEEQAARLETLSREVSDKMTEIEALKSQLESQDESGELAQLREDLVTANQIIGEQNETIEKMDSEKGTETGNFIEHASKKLQVRIPSFTLKGKKYGINDLRENVEITILGKNNKNEQIGLVDYLLRIKSPIVEIEE